ncbi:T9SS type A sorting domain-containing protein [Flammeovirga pectinis]|uniref:T9SS type A sorting domain-containing protein n=1 Tax=Flammeovirga pectinis TaxID=2494373 RepID=A0A3S9P163_9BACT|nr:T9SS type A sorting domain-containing protein [Flammeovirga pectinis]AZQ61906.1 T9SS type A sorting domain-containing protein [Flammeovirga pectinis]
MTNIAPFIFTFLFFINSINAQVIENDSLVLVDIYNTNPNSTLTWNLNNNVSSWEGIEINNSKIIGININSKNIAIIPESIGNLSALQKLITHTNPIKVLPETIGNLTSLYWFSPATAEINHIPNSIKALNLTTIYIQLNNLGYSAFEGLSIIPNNYAPQNNISSDTSILLSQYPYTLNAPDSATNNQYQWYNENGAITNETNRSINISQDGTYHCIITNADFTALAQVQTGTYTLINAAPFLADSTAIANIYTLNVDNTLNWDLSQPINTWEGITHSGNPTDRVTQVNISTKTIDALPTDINVLDALSSFSLDNNALIFEELEKITQAYPSTFNYAPQEVVGTSNIYEHTGNAITLTLPTEINSTNNSYQWYKDGNHITTNGNNNTYTTNELGTFYCLITNTLFPELTLQSANQFILNKQQFEIDSTAVADIYTKNVNNTLSWDLNQPITTWEGISFYSGRINQVKINNSLLDTLPSTIVNLNALDTLLVQENQLTFESLENISTNYPINFKYDKQEKIGTEQYLDATGNITVTLELPTDFDPNTTNNTYQWYLNDLVIPNANSRSYNTNQTGLYYCKINNIIFTELTLQSQNYIVFNQDLLAADSTVVAKFYTENNANTLTWDLTQPINTWEGISINFSRVTAINIENQNIENIPSDIGQLEYLDSLLLKDNNINTIPSDIGRNTQISTIDFSNNGISSLPDEVSQLINLKKVALQNNTIEALPNGIQNWTNIDTLIINDNKLTFEDITLTPNTIDHYIYSPQDSIGNSRQIFSNRDQLLSIDTNVDNGIQNMTFEWFKNNTIIPNETDSTYLATEHEQYYYTFKNTIYDKLTLTSKIIAILPGNSVDEVDSLVLIDILQQNPNTTLTWDTNETIDNWEGVTTANFRITELNISEKNIAIIPESIGNLSALQKLITNTNPIKILPETIGNLTNLYLLTPAIAEISHIPNSIKALNLTSIYIQLNNLGYSAFEGLSRIPNNYAPQNNISSDTSILLSQYPYTLNAPDSATNNQYQWYNENGAITNETNRSINISQDGTYHCIITNADFTALAQVQTGTYTLINAAPFLADSTAIANIYTLNVDNTLNWDLNQPINTWEGITHSGNPTDRVTQVNISTKTIDALPTDINVLDALSSFSLDNNALIFEELEKITQAYPSTFNYAPQEVVGTSNIYEHTGNAITLTLPTEINSTNNSYQWYKDGNHITTNGNNNTYTTNELGTFYCLITNTLFPELTLQSANQFILNKQQFEIDSTAVADIYTKNVNNTLSWDLNQPITTWEGISFYSGRINQVKINNSLLDTLPSTIVNLNALDTLLVQENQLTFESLENISTNYPINFKYDKQEKIGTEQYLDATGNITVTLELPTDFDPNTTNNTYQWYLNDLVIPNANSRSYNTNQTGLYYCKINNIIFTELTLQSQNYIVFNQDLLAADSTVVAKFYTENNANTLTWDLTQPINTWEGISINFSRVTAINIENQNIENIPSDIGQLEYLDSLLLKDNNINTIPSDIGRNTQISTIDFSNNGISSLPDEVSQLINLKKVALQNNTIEALPNGIQNWTNIDTLIINDNKLTFEDITLTPNTIDHYIYSPQDSIGNSRQIFSNRDQLLSIDTNVDNGIQNMTFEWFKNNTIIPNETDSTYLATEHEQYYYTFKNTIYDKLTLTSKIIAILPGNSVDEVDSLVLIDILQQNPNTTLTWDTNETIDNWEGVTTANFRITELNISEKNIAIIPESIGNLSALQKLITNTNPIKILPETIGNLTNLYLLTPAIAEISHIPNSIKALNLTSIYIQLNNLGYSAFEGLSRIPNNYAPQNNISSDTSILLSQYPYTLTAPDSAINNQYQWHNENGAITNETNRSINISQDGTYHCIITNADFTALAQVQTGTYTLINAAPFLADSTAIANISTLNVDNTLNWDLSQPINTWEGITHSGNPTDRVTQVNISTKNIDVLPADINVLDALSILKLDNNALIFEELEKITQAYPSTFNYAPQEVVGTSNIYEHTGNAITLTLPTEINSTNNSYQWYKDGNHITTNGNNNTYTTNELGTFYCLITNTLFPELTLQSANQFILNKQQFEIDSTAVADIYTKNINNTLSWDLNQPITTWEGISFYSGRINQVKINNSLLDTLPSTIVNLNALDTLLVQKNQLTFESLENISTNYPVNFKYDEQEKIGTEQYLDATGNTTVTLELPTDFDPNTTNNTYQWYLNDLAISNANNRSYNTNQTGLYYCKINNIIFTELTLQSQNYIVFNQDLLAADSTVVAKFYTENNANTLTWDLTQSINTWEGISINFSRVTAINIENQNIENIPSDIGQLEYLDSLLLKDNNINTIPSDIGRNTRISTIDFSNNEISSLPNEVNQLINLKKVALQNNTIEALPNGIQNWTNIDTLIINDNKLSFEDITLTPNTIDHYIYSPQDSIGNSRQIFSNRDQLLSIDTNVDNGIQNMTFEWFKNNTIIPNETDSTYLATEHEQYYYTFKNNVYDQLTLTSKTIAILPSNSMDEVDSLVLIDILQQNPNTTLTWDTNETIDNWEGVTTANFRITELDISEKNIAIIPESIGNLSALQKLITHTNPIKVLPETIGNLTSLYWFSPATAEINHIPNSIKALNLTTIYIQLNNLGYSAFEGLSIIPNNYAPQNNISSDTSILLSQYPYTLTAPDSATNNQYQWYNENGAITNETNRSINISQDGSYHCIITNANFPALAQVKTGTYTMIDATQFYADSLALLSLKASNPQVNLNWSTTLPVSNWEHITQSGGTGTSVSATRLSSIGLTNIPVNFMDNGALMVLDTFDISDNALVFYDLYNAEAIINQTAQFISYTPQAIVGIEQSVGYTGSPIKLSIDARLQDTRNTYLWFKDGIAQTSETDSTLTTSTVGEYYCQVSNQDFQYLELYSASNFIYDQQFFDNDSIIVSTIYTDNINNTLGWHLDQPITTWHGVTLRGGRVYELALDSKTLSTLPSNFGELTALTSLKIGNNEFTNIPDISNLSQLLILELNNNNLSTIPTSIYSLISLERLILDANKINTVEQKFSNLSNLDCLAIRNNFLTFDDILLLPEPIKEESISYYKNQGIAGSPQYVATSGYIHIVVDQTIDPSLRDVNTYQWFYVIGNDTIPIPNSNNDSLLINNQFEKFHTKINNPAITDLTLITASIYVSPEKTNEQDSLVLLALQSTSLNPNNTLNWPITSPVGTWEGIKVDGASARITTLDIWNKNIDELPASFSTLSELNNVNISANNLVELPGGIDNLDSLLYINISNNHLSFAEMDKLDPKVKNDDVNFVYGNQKNIGYEGTTVELANGFNYLDVPEEDRTTNDFYQWYRNGSIISGENKDSLRVNKTGEYNYTISNERYDNILLTSYSITVDGNVTSIGKEIGGKIKLYPNPTSNNFIIETSNAVRIEDVKVYDVVGNIYTDIYNTSSLYKWSIDLEGKPIGMYLVWVKTDNGEVTMKVFKK